MHFHKPFMSKIQPNSIKNAAISFCTTIVCAQFTAENGAHDERELYIDFHFAAITCWLLHFHKVGKLRKTMV